MSLGTALSSGLESYMAVRGEQRKQQHHDLQTEGMTLRNEGYRLNNDFERESYGFRLDQERGDANFATGRGRTAVAEANQEEEIERRGLRVGQEAEKLNYERNRGNYWGQRATEAGSDARVALNTESSRANKIHADAEKAYQQAVQAGVTTRNEASQFYGEQLLGIANGRTINEALQDESFAGTAVAQLETQFDNLLSEGQRVAGLVYNEEADGYMIATRMPDGSIKPITDRRSADGDDPVTVFSEDEVSAALFGESAGDYRTRQAQNQGAQNVINQQVGSAQQEHVQGVEGLGHRRVQAQQNAETVEQVGRSLSQLREQRAALEARVKQQVAQAGVPQALTTTGGVAPGEQDGNAEARDLQTQIASVDSAIESLEEEHAPILARSADEWRALDQQFASQLNGQGDQWQRTLRDFGGMVGEAQRVSTASDGEVSTEDAVRNITGRGPSLAALTPSERLEQQSSDVKNQGTMTEAMDASFERIASTFEDSVAARELKDRGFAQEDVSRALRSARAAVFRSSSADNDVFQKLTTGTPRERLGAEVLLTLALEQSIGQGGDVGTRIDGILADYSPASIDMAAEFANDEAFAGAKSSDRYNAVQRAIGFMENEGLNATQAKTRALQEMSARN